MNRAPNGRPALKLGCAHTPNGSIYSFGISGAPRTKKTSNRIFRAGKRLRIMPSAAHQAWFERAMLDAPKIRRRLESFDCKLPITTPVSVRAEFYRDANRGDATGYYQALADYLERAGIIANDKLIADWDGSRLFVDREFPHIEVQLVIPEVTA